MATIRNIVLVLLLLNGWSLEGQATKKIALLIGNSSYEMYSDLAGIPHNDVDALGEKLALLGFKTMVFKDLTKVEMNTALNNFIDTIVIEQYEVAFFVYSGHGGQNSINDDYLIPVQLSATVFEDEQLSQQCIAFADVVDKMNSAACLKHRVILYDACRNVASLDEKNGMTDGAQKNLKYQGFVISYSVSSGNKAYNEYMGKQLSPYIIALLRYLDNMESIVEIIVKAHNDVLGMTQGKQIPYIGIGGNENGILFLSGENAPSDFVRIDAQNLRMGDRDPKYKAAPIVETKVAPFFIQTCPVSNEAFVFFLNAYFLQDLNNSSSFDFYKNKIHPFINIGKNEGIELSVEGSRRFFQVVEGYENYPVTYVSWEGAKLYARWKDLTDTRFVYALPSEKHWECWADRNGNNFKGNDALSKQKNEKSALSDGAMCHPFGNIMEWTSDTWIAAHKRTDGVAENNETRATVKGCSYTYNQLEECHPAYRRALEGGTRKANLGFRLVYLPTQ